MRRQSIYGSARIMILLFTYVPTSIAVTTVWVGNGGDVKIYDFAGNYILEFKTGYADAERCRISARLVAVRGRSKR